MKISAVETDGRVILKTTMMEERRRVLRDQVLEGTWEEVALQAAKLAGSGRKVKLIIPSVDSETRFPPENAAVIALLEEWLEEDRAISPEEREETT